MKLKLFTLIPGEQDITGMALVAADDLEGAKYLMDTYGYPGTWILSKFIGEIERPFEEIIDVVYRLD